MPYCVVEQIFNTTECCGGSFVYLGMDWLLITLHHSCRKPSSVLGRKSSLPLITDASVYHPESRTEFNSMTSIFWLFWAKAVLGRSVTILTASVMPQNKLECLLKTNLTKIQSLDLPQNNCEQAMLDSLKLCKAKKTED